MTTKTPTLTATTPAPGSAAVGAAGTPARGLPVTAGTRDYANLPHACRCGARWSGTATCHCGGCHLTFTGITAFDTHRPGGNCTPPDNFGLVRVDGRAYQCWGFPSQPAEES